MMSSLSMVYGLVFSGVAGSALSPFEVADWAEGSTERLLANFYNLAASLQFSICIGGVLFTTYFLVFINTQPDTVIFKCVSNFNFTIVYMYLIFYSTYLLLAQLCARVYIRSDPEWAWATIGILLTFFLVLFNHWIYAMRDAFPIASLHFMPAFAALSFNPHIALQLFGRRWTQFKRSAQHTAEVMIQEAGNNFGNDVVNKLRRDVSHEQLAHQAGADGSSPPVRKKHSSPRDIRVVPEGTNALSESGKELAAVLKNALAHSSPDRRDHIINGLLIEELTVPRLLAMAKLNIVVLDSALKTDNMRVQMLTGERFAIIETICAMASGTASAAREKGPEQ